MQDVQKPRDDTPQRTMFEVVFTENLRCEVYIHFQMIRAHYFLIDNYISMWENIVFRNARCAKTARRHPIQRTICLKLFSSKIYVVKYNRLVLVCHCSSLMYIVQKTRKRWSYTASGLGTSLQFSSFLLYTDTKRAINDVMMTYQTSLCHSAHLQYERSL